MKSKKILMVLPVVALLAACGAASNNSSVDNTSKTPESSLSSDGGNQSSQGNQEQSSENKPSSASSSAGGASSASSQGNSSIPGSSSQGVPSSSDKPSSTPISVDPSTSQSSVENPTNTSEITDLTKAGISYDAANKVFEITAAGEYFFSGQFEGNIVVNAGDEDDVKVTLNEFTIISDKDAPIKCNSANELQVSLKKSTHNYIYDNRTHRTEADETQGNGAITSSADLKISGKGNLNIVANYFNGIHSKDDLKVKPDTSENGGKVQINSYNNCLKGNDSVTIESGNLVLISTDGNGIMTENTDISSKGNQRGTISITGGQVDIYCSKDGLDAAYNVDISRGETATADPIVNIYTNKYSQYSSTNPSTGGDSTTSSVLYLKSSSSLNQAYFGVAFKNDAGEITWVKATSATQPQGSRSYYFQLNKPKDAVSLKICTFSNSVTTMSDSTATAKMKDFSSINTNFNMATISISGTTVNMSSWSNYSTQSQGGGGGGWGGPGGMQEGNSDKADYSAKGIKAHNNINISAGTFYIKAYDDTLHASYGDVFENGATGEGKLNISGGYFTLYAADDAVHADNEVNISGGTIDILTSYEGVEANTINILGGYTKVYALDDGLNAASKVGKTPNINISGGVTDITVYGGDIDGIDSNGNFTMTGGIVVTKGGSGGMSTGFDIDGTAKVNGGTFIGMGPMEKTPSAGSGITQYSLSGSWGAGNHVITFPDKSTLTVTSKYSYSQIRVWSDNSNKISVS